MGLKGLKDVIGDNKILVLITIAMGIFGFGGLLLSDMFIGIDPTLLIAIGMIMFGILGYGIAKLK